MNTLDEMLAQLGRAPLPPRLALMDGAVFSAMAEQRGSSANNPLHSLSIAAIAALAFGIVSTGFSGSPAAAASAVSPFGVPPALAPSSLLLASK